MGEYAKVNGQHVKLGTCENLYYIRWDQRGQVAVVGGMVDGSESITHYCDPKNGYRFRFPFPDEDHVEIGAFEPYDRGFRIPCRSDQSFAVCVEHKGVADSVLVTQQRPMPDGKLWTVLDCGVAGCHHKWRLPPEEANVLVRHIMELSKTMPRDTADELNALTFLLDVGIRIMQGYVEQS